uniref:Uncharacterized protein n=1 Tax=Junco hyemalis TaxID=40217 RepID=A0A8C5JFX6_JUNHY
MPTAPCGNANTDTCCPPRSIIEDVIEGVRELFAEEGVEEQVLKDLKQLKALWCFRDKIDFLFK